MAALRFEIQGMVRGRAALIVEHVTRLRDDLAPDWPQPTGSGCYRILVKGSPSLTCELTLEGEDGDHNTGGLVATAMRILNAIPALCAAKPGLLSALDLPLVTARHLVR
jgi:4-hydroxy-tetrahydrodipicolinate reductase